VAIYEYFCSKCKQVFPLQRPMSESDKSASCPKCGAESQRVLSSFASKIDYNLQIPGKEPFRKLDQEG
jgi:putative FmdB family regulatory protein